MDKHDIRLGIYTGGIVAKYADALHRVDQPTPYEVLEKIAENSILSPEDVLVDYGCGRGRICFYLADKVGCRCVGIERAAPIFERTIKNLEAYTGDKSRVSFHNAEAEYFDLMSEQDKPTAFYMFNPFAGQIFEQVYENIREYSAKAGKKVKLILYEPGSWLFEYMRAEAKDAGLIREIDLRNDRFDYPFKKVYVWEIGGE